MNQSSENHLSLLIKKALDHHVAGRIDQAEILYQQVLKVDPTHPIALNQLGTVALQKGNFKPIIKWLRENVHRKGNFFKIDELLKESTEENLNLKYFESHIIDRYIKKEI